MIDLDKYLEEINNHKDWTNYTFDCEFISLFIPI